MANDAVLYTRMEVRLADAEKKLAKFQANVDKNMSGVDRSAKRAARSMEASFAGSFQKLGGIVSASLGGLLAGIAGAGITGLISSFREVAGSVAEIGDAAKMAGLSAKAFQEWRYVAEQTRIPIDAITDGLKEMQLRADEFAVTGKGSAAEAFGRIGMTPAEVQERLKNPSELLLTIIERTKQLNDTAASIRIFDELFGGTGGERMVNLLAQGESGIRDIIKAANDSGAIIDEQLIQKAAEVDAKFNAIAATVGSTLKSAIVSAADSLAEFIDGFRAFENQATSTLSRTQADVGLKRLDIENKLLEIGDKQDRQSSRRRAVLKQELAELTAQDAQITNALSNRIQPMARSGNDTWTPPPKAPAPPAGGTTSGAKSARSEADAVRDLITQLDYEYSLIGKTELEKEQLNALRQAGASATAEERAAIEAKVAAIYNETRAMDAAKQAADEAQAAARDFAGSLVDGLMNGQSAAEVLASSLKRLASQIVSSGLDALFGMGGGGGGNIFSLLGFKNGGEVRGYAGGGQLRGPGTGRSDSMLIRASNGEFMVNAAATKRHRALLEAINSGNLPKFANGGAVGRALSLPQISARRSGNGFPSIASIKVGVSVDNDGNLQAYVKDVAATTANSAVSSGLQAYDRKVLPDSIARVNRNPNRR